MVMPRLRLLLTISAVLILGIVAVGIVQAQDSPDPAATSQPSAHPHEHDEEARPRHERMRDRHERMRDRHERMRDRLEHRGPWGGPFKRLGRLDRLVHAEAVIDLPERGLTRYTVDVGDITAVGSDGAVTIARRDGQSVTIATDDETRVRKDRERVEVAALAVGDHVYAVAVEQDGTLVARQIRVFEVRTVEDSQDGTEEASPSASPTGG